MRRVGFGLAFLAIAFLVAVIATAHWGDRSLWPAPPGTQAIPIFIINHGYHAGIVVPRAALAKEASERGLGPLIHVTTRFSAFDWLEFGWGEEGFYTQVPTIAQLTPGMAVRALLLPGNRSVLHVVGLPVHPRSAFPNFDVVPIDLADAGFARLVDRLDATFTREEGGAFPVELGPGLYGPSLFFRANGTFHLFNVCNHWIARLLDAAGVPTAPVLATLPRGLLLDLKWRSGLVPMPPHAVATAHS